MCVIVVQELGVDSNMLTGEIPTELGRLVMLEVVYCTMSVSEFISLCFFLRDYELVFELILC